MDRTTETAGTGWIPELSDALAVIGLALIGVGLWMVHVALALVVVGVLLLAASFRV